MGFSNPSRLAANAKVLRVEAAIAKVKRGEATGTVGAFVDLYCQAKAKPDNKVYPQVYQVTEIATGKVIYQERVSDARINTFEAEGLDVNGNRIVKVESTKAKK